MLLGKTIQEVISLIHADHGGINNYRSYTHKGFASDYLMIVETDRDDKPTKITEYKFIDNLCVAVTELGSATPHHLRPICTGHNPINN